MASKEKTSPVSARNANEVLKEFNNAARSVMKIKNAGSGSSEEYGAIFSNLSKQLKELVRDVSTDSDLKAGETDRIEKAGQRILEAVPKESTEKARSSLSKFMGEIEGSAYQKALERITGLTNGLKELSESYSNGIVSGAGSVEAAYQKVQKAMGDIFLPYSESSKEGDDNLTANLPQKEAQMAKDLKLIKKIAIIGPVIDTLNMKLSEIGKHGQGSAPATETKHNNPIAPEPAEEKIFIPEFLRKKHSKSSKVVDITESLLDRKLVEEARLSKKKKDESIKLEKSVNLSAANEGQMPALYEDVGPVQKQHAEHKKDLSGLRLITKKEAMDNLNEHKKSPQYHVAAADSPLQKHAPDASNSGSGGIPNTKNAGSRDNSKGEKPIIIDSERSKKLQEFIKHRGMMVKDIQESRKSLEKMAEDLMNKCKEGGHLSDKVLEDISKANVSLFVKINAYQDYLMVMKDGINGMYNEKKDAEVRDSENGYIDSAYKFIKENGSAANGAMEWLAEGMHLGVHKQHMEMHIIRYLQTDIYSKTESSQLGLIMQSYAKNPEESGSLYEQIERYSRMIRSKLEEHNKGWLDYISITSPALPHEVISQLSYICVNFGLMGNANYMHGAQRKTDEEQEEPITLRKPTIH